MDSIPSISMNNGNGIPQLGLGLWKIKKEDVFNAAFEAALAAGYTHFDTAQAYGNEALLGAAWQRQGIDRKDIFITTKIRVENIALGRTTKSFRDSLNHLRTDYVDLLLLHFPVPNGRKKAWLELEMLQESGLARNIGVSNYTIRHLEELKTYAKVMPAINQVELHVFLQQPQLVDYCRRNGIVLEAYSPLAHGRRMKDKTVQAVADRHGKTYAQVMLRWCVENGFVLLPKSVTPAYISENTDIYSFELYLDELRSLAKLNRGLRTAWNPTLIP